MFENIQRTPDVVMIEEKQAFPDGGKMEYIREI